MTRTPDGDSPDVTVTVVICAYTDRRWDDICAAVASVEAQQPAVDDLLLVIDHNQALLERATGAFPGARVLANEETQGLSGPATPECATPRAR